MRGRQAPDDAGTKFQVSACVSCLVMLIDNPADCEARAVIRFLNAIHFCLVEIHRQLAEMDGDNVVNDGSVHKQCMLFNEGRTNVHDEDQSVWPTVIIEDLL